MEAWKRAWREGFCPSLTTAGIESLRTALADDDPKLMQGATLSPLPNHEYDLPVEKACAVTYCGVIELGGFRLLQKPGEPYREDLKSCLASQAEAFFSLTCFQADLRLGNPSECMWFLNWFDETPRDEMRRLLLEEVNLELQKRASQGQLQVPSV